MRKRLEMDMCNGPLLKKVWAFSIPLMLSGILQLLFNMVDMVVVGRFVNSAALAAVGSTGSMVNLIVNLFMGLSVGAGVVVAQRFGASDTRGVSDTVHTSMLFSVIGGIVVGIIGLFVSRPLLVLMQTPEGEVLDMAHLYVFIYFCGLPAIGIYNFGASILRAVGDTRRPMIFLILSGLLNLALNLFFVLVLPHLLSMESLPWWWGVTGVALATVLSQCLAAFLTVRCLMHTDGCFRLYIRELRLHPKVLKTITRIGMPAGIQGALFSVSNMLIQSSINFFGTEMMAGNTAASNIDGFAYVALNAFSQAAITFTGQNFGAKKLTRVPRVLLSCAGSVTVLGIVLSAAIFLLRYPLLSLYDTDTEVIEAGIVRLTWVLIPYFLCGMMETVVGVLRGLGRSVMPMIVSLLGSCVFRIIWIYTVFEIHKKFWVIFVSYPISWAITTAVHFICFAIVYKLEKKKALTDEFT